MSYQRALFLTFLLLLGSVVACAQQRVKPCTTNKNSPPASTWHWPAGTRVKVYVMRGMFTSSQQQAIREVMDQWNGLSEQAGTGIKFEFAGGVDQLQDGFGYLTLTRLEIQKGTNNKFYAYFFRNRGSDLSIYSALIAFDFKTIDATAFRSYVAHEMAHGMGLWDCKSCKGKSTIMNAFPDVNKDNGLIAPSACDIEVVTALFNQKRLEQLSNH
jgi:hypothetical protein